MEIQYFIKFQFHYGSIKISRKPSSRRNYSRFNSTMVRLKFTLYASPTSGNVFQFHYGSIKIVHMIRRKLFCLHCFNSTMVRLKFSCAPKNAMENVFQFHYGSIKILTSKCLLRI